MPYHYWLLGALILFVFALLVVAAVRPSKNSKKSITPPEPFKKWIKGSGYEDQPLWKQHDLYGYYKMVHRAAEEGSSEVLPNNDALHGTIAVAVIIETAKKFVTMIINNRSEEILSHPMCVRAIEKAKSKGVLIGCGLSDSQFVVFNDCGMRRIETCSLKHSAQVYF